MKRKIYNLLSNSKQGLFGFALTVFSGTAYSQTTINVNYTGAVQTLTVPAGVWGIQCWGADGGDVTAGPGGGGKGGYSQGQISVLSTTTLYVLVGGKGGSVNGSSGPSGNGGWNGGGGGGYCGKSAGGGGGASDVRLGGLAATNRIIVGGGGGGAAYYNLMAVGGHGGAPAGQHGDYMTSGNILTPLGGGAGANGASPGLSTNGFPSTSGTATGGGGGGNSPGGFGQQGTGGGSGGTGGSSANGATGSSGGGGGGYAGGAGGTQTVNAGVGGGGGSGYIGGVTSGTTIMFSTPGFVPNPTLTGNGMVRITELCDISLVAAGNTNSLSPMICSGQSLTLTTNAISNYSWSTGATTSSIVVAPTTNTVYSLSATSPSNCTTSRTISVTVNSGIPVLSISTNPSNNICLGRTVFLTASGAISYTWTNPGVVNGQTFTPSSTAVYTVSGQNGCGITVATTTVTVAPLPVSAAVSPTLVCEGFPATLTAVSAVGGYTWQPGPLFGATPIVATMVNTIYTVTASDGTCSGTQTVSLLTKPTPTITAAITSTLICEGESVTLTASGAGTGGSYNWTPGGAGSQITMSPITSSLFAVAGTNSVNCTAGAQAVVVVVAAPAMNVVANKTLVCIQSSAILTASGAQSYTWTNGPFVGTYTATPTAAMTIYTVTGSHQTNTCLATRTIAIAALIPNVTVTSSVGICEGASAVLTASGATTYSWNGINNGASGVFQPTPPVTTVYNLIAFTNSNNVSCPSLHTATVIVYPTPTLAVTPAKQTICKGETHTLTVTGAVNYTWSPTGTGSVITVKPNTTSSYQVTGVDEHGCENTFLYTAKVSSCLGINESGLDKVISVFPNPSSGEFVVSAGKDIRIELINELGQHLRSITLDATNNREVKFNDLAAGIYFIKAENGEDMLSQKIVITK